MSQQLHALQYSNGCKSGRTLAYPDVTLCRAKHLAWWRYHYRSRTQYDPSRGPIVTAFIIPSADTVMYSPTSMNDCDILLLAIDDSAVAISAYRDERA